MTKYKRRKKEGKKDKKDNKKEDKNKEEENEGKGDDDPNQDEKLEEGDEILTTNHEYGAMDRTWNFYSEKAGVKYIRQNITLPIISKEQIMIILHRGNSA